VLPATVPSGRWLSSNGYFFLEVQPRAHWHASTHFFAEISPLRLARDRGMGLWLPTYSAATLAHSSASSLPATHLCAGHHQILMMPGLALRSIVMCFHAWRVYCWLVPGSSDAIHLIAGYISVKIVTYSGVMFLLDTSSSAWMRVAHSAS